MAYFVHDDFSSSFFLISQLLPVHPNPDTGLSYLFQQVALIILLSYVWLEKYWAAILTVLLLCFCRGEHDVLYG